MSVVVDSTSKLMEKNNLDCTEIDRIKDNAEPSPLRLLRNTSYCKICEKDVNNNNKTIFTDFGRSLYDSISESLNEKVTTEEKKDILNACFGSAVINDKES